MELSCPLLTRVYGAQLFSLDTSMELSCPPLTRLWLSPLDALSLTANKGLSLFSGLSPLDAGQLVATLGKLMLFGLGSTIRADMVYR
eukprot:1161253-Pelagomonas_calceolata.AAC.1